MKTLDQQLEDAQVEPIARFCAEHRGTISRIHEAYQVTNGEPMNRDSIERWVHRDPERRMTTRHGAGLLLYHVSRRVMREVLIAEAVKTAERQAADAGEEVTTSDITRIRNHAIEQWRTIEREFEEADVRLQAEIDRRLAGATAGK